MSILHFIAVLFLLPVVILMAIRHLGRRRVGVPSCPRCLYNVTGLTSRVCPECGANLDEVGVLEPGKLKPLGRVAYGSIFTAILGAVALLISPPLLRLVPPLWGVSGQRAFASPASGLYQSVTVSADHTFRYAKNGRAPVLTVILKTDHSTSAMEVDYTNRESRFIDSGGKQIARTLSFDDREPAATLFEWFKVNGISSNTAVRAEVAELAEALQEHASAVPDLQKYQGMFVSTFTGDYFAAKPYVQQKMTHNGFSRGAVFARRSDSSSAGPMADPWPLRILRLAWAGLWVLGSVTIWLLVGRKLRTPAADPRIARGIMPVSATEGGLLCEVQHSPSAS
ncbi:MAG: hypothetical protein L0219_18220, partial [Phycisphaerales bacterium]|nr:hypothetical protein [Phycisphaerales bacterium]